MALTFHEADLFLRFGDDLRRGTWPHGDFIRWHEETPTEPAGYVVTPYTPTSTDLLATDWRRA